MVTEVTEVTAFLGEGIGRNSHTLELQELGGLMQIYVHCADALSRRGAVMHGRDVFGHTLKLQFLRTMAVGGVYPPCGGRCE